MKAARVEAEHIYQLDQELKVTLHMHGEMDGLDWPSVACENALGKFTFIAEHAPGMGHWTTAVMTARQARGYIRLSSLPYTMYYVEEAL